MIQQRKRKGAFHHHLRILQAFKEELEGIGSGIGEDEDELRALDLRLARLSRKRRSLVRDRRHWETNLSDLEALIKGAPEGASSQLYGELDMITEKLDEIDLTIAAIDRERRILLKRRSFLEGRVMLRS